MNLKNIILSGRSQSPKYMHVSIHIYIFHKGKICIYIYVYTCMYAYMLLLLFSHEVVSNFSVTPWTVVHQAPLSMGFSRQEYWSGLPFPSPGELPKPGIKPASSASQAGSLQLSH